jgi:3-oxoadipate enol-lactonase
VICGLSVGGQIALGLADRAPGRVSGLILMDTAHRIGTAESWNERIAAVERDGIGAIADMILARWLSAAFRQSHPAETAGIAAMLTRTPAAGYAATCAALRDSDLTAAARAVRVPTQCIVGGEDGSTPPDLVQSLAALIPDAAFTLLPGLGHLPCLERPDLVADLILRFIEENRLA